jgi:uncharacterized protein YbjT (DUF2867 family)
MKIVLIGETGEGLTPRNLLAAAAGAAVGHLVALSVVGTDRLPESGHCRAKLLREKLLTASSIPYSIVRTTQLFGLAKRIARAATDGDTVRLAPALIQPIAAGDLTSAVGRIVLSSPVNAIVEVAGLEQSRLDELARCRLAARNDPHEVVADPSARYFGAALGERTVLTGDGAVVCDTRSED